MFDKALRAFEMGDLRYSDLQSHLDRLLETGASPRELANVLLRHHQIEPLPEYVHDEFLQHLNEAIEETEARSRMEEPAAAETDGSPVVEDANGAGAEAPAQPDDGHPANERIASEQAEHAALARAYERARESASAAAAQVDSLDAELAAARTELETERNHSQLLTKALADARASADAASQRGEDLAQALAESRASADAASQRGEELARALAESRASADAASQRGEDLARALAESRASATAPRPRGEQSEQELQRLLGELRAARESLHASEKAAKHAGALAAELAVALNALEAERNHGQELTRALAESNAYADAAQERSERSADELERLRGELRAARESLHASEAAAARAGALAAELAAARTALEVERNHVQEIAQALAENSASVDGLRKHNQELTQALAESNAFADAVQARSEQAGQELERLRSELQAARESLHSSETVVKRAGDFAAELAAARTALEAERNSSEELAQALAESQASADAARAKTAQTGQELEYLRGELQTARDAVFTHETTITELERRVKGMQAEMQAVRSRAAAAVAELKVSQDAGVALKEQRARAESDLVAARGEIDAMQDQLNSYLELLQTHEWRRGVDEDIARVMEVPPAAPRTPVTVTSFAGLFANFAGRANYRLIGIGAAVIVLAVVAWALIDHRSGSVHELAQAAVEAPAPPPEQTQTSVGAPVQATAQAASQGRAVSSPGTVIRDCPACPSMTVLPAGRFKQGSAYTGNGTLAFERPLHWVLIGLPFAMSTNVVTVDQFRAFTAATGRDMQGCETYDGKWKLRIDRGWNNPGFEQAGSHPVTCVSWVDASAYAAWLSSKTGHRYRLPSASEWEYAASVGGASEQPWTRDGSAACAHANVADASAAHRYPGWTVFDCNDGYVHTAPVGSFKANAWGLNDMLGNVLQWTEDCWYADYKGAPIDGSPRTGGDCSEHELRGGSWFSAPAFVRANYRNRFAANYRTSTVGIRLVRELTP